MTENRIFTLCRMITWVVFLRMFWNFISSLPVKRGGSLSFLVGTISNVLVMEIGWTDVGSGGYILVSNTSFHFFLLIQILDRISLQCAANEMNERCKKCTKRIHEMKRTNYTENANARNERTKQMHDTRTNESLERNHILSNDKRSWFYRSTI